MNHRETVQRQFPEAHCAPLADARYPDFYVIRATRAEWADTLGKGPTPDQAWKAAADEKGTVMSEHKKILCLDFDGVCHAYTSGWQGADVIPDEYVSGLFEFLEEAKKEFDIHIFSSRSHQPGGREAMLAWFTAQRKLWRERGGMPPENTELTLSFPEEKPSAFVSLDDRCLLFTGTWPSVQELKGFVPWNKKGDGHVRK